MKAAGQRWKWEHIKNNLAKNSEEIKNELELISSAYRTNFWEWKADGRFKVNLSNPNLGHLFSVLYIKKKILFERMDIRGNAKMSGMFRAFFSAMSCFKLKFSNASCMH